MAWKPSHGLVRTVYDEERLRWLGRRMRFPRIRKNTAFLLLIDVMVIIILVCLIEPLITLLRRNEELFGPRFEIPGSDGHPLEGPIEIPRILHQTCANDTIPEKWVYPQRTCKGVYSDFEYKLWTDDLAREFLAAEYPWFVDIWDNYTFPIQRADSIRYFVLNHFGGIYLDMDTICREPFPIELIEGAGHRALFKSTTPTGVTNDFMISTAGHPAFAAAVTKLPVYYRMTRLWAWLEPYTAIMLSSGPLFITLVVEDYLLKLPFLPSPTVQVIASSKLHPYITDLESSTWHRWDTGILMWMGERPWSWFSLGFLGLIVGAYVFNRALMILFRAPRKILSAVHSLKRR